MIHVLVSDTLPECVIPVMLWALRLQVRAFADAHQLRRQNEVSCGSGCYLFEHVDSPMEQEPPTPTR